MNEEETVRYRFGPLERRGLIAGWRGGQLATVAVALVIDVVIVRSAPDIVGVAAAMLVLGLAVASATWPFAGRTAEQWAPDAVRHLHGELRRRTASRPGLFSTLQLLPVSATAGAPEAAVVVDRATRTYTVVVRASAGGFALAGAPEKAARVASWSAVLASLARQGSTVHRVQWVARCIPDEGEAVRRHFDDGARTRSGPAADSYRALLDSQLLVTPRHEVLVALSVDARRSARVVRSAGGGDAGAAAVALREMQLLRRQLSDAGITTGDPLDATALASVVTDASATSAGPVSSTSMSGGALSVGRRWPWPMGVEARWDCARVDGSWHATYWIAEWPRIDVSPEFLAPLLVADVRRTTTVVMEPVDPVAATRRIEQARTADVADAELRRRGGFLATARRRREEEQLTARETELADGHAHYRFCGYVTVSALDEPSLHEACARTEQAAGRAGLDLRRCYGDQGRAFTCTLPLGRGLG